jgi:heme-degrading monooxygenase HmoA
MGKSKDRTTNWPEYNKALVSSFWIDEQAIKQWCCTEHHGGEDEVFSIAIPLSKQR